MIDFSVKKRIELQYKRNLNGLFKHLYQYILDGDYEKVISSKVFGSFCNSIASRMITGLAVENAKDWRAAAREGMKGRVIYEALNDVKAAMTGMLAPTFKELIQGRVEIRQIFTINKVIIAGAYVTEGKVFKSSQVRVIRDGIVVHEGTLESLRRFKDDVKEVAAGYECGVTVDNFRDLKEGDILEAFTMEQIKPKG